MIKPAQLLRGAGAASTLDHPLDHLKACHRRIEDRLATLERVIPFLSTKRAEALEAVGNVIRFLDTNGVLHTADEEESLFPRLQPKASPEEVAFFEHLENDHEAAEAVYAGLKTLTALLDRQSERTAELIPRFAELVGELCAIYRRHIHEEDSRLHEIARRLLHDTELADISHEMKHRRGLE